MQHQGTCSEVLATLAIKLPFPAAILIANPWQKKRYRFFLAVKTKNKS